MARKGGTVCAYRGCSSRTGGESSLFTFPKDPLMAEIWLKACNREDLLGKPVKDLHKNYKLCEKHFEDKYISKSGGMRKHLFQQAIPTIFSHALKRSAPDDLCSEEFTEKGIVISDNNMTIASSVEEECETFTPGFSSKSDAVSIDPTSQDSLIKCTPSPIARPSSKTDENLTLDIIGMSPIAGPSSKSSKTDENLTLDITGYDTSPIAGPSSKSYQNLTLDITEFSMRQTSSAMLSPVSTQTPAALSSRTPRKQKLREKLKNLKRRRIFRAVVPKKRRECSLQDFAMMCDKFLDKPFAEIVKMQAKIKGKKPIARRYSMEYKQFALTLYFLGPRAYAFMSKLLYLPTKRSLERMTEKLICKPGLQNDNILKAFEIKVKTMVEQDKHCMLCIDEMSLKSNLFYHTGRDEIVGLHDIGIGRKELLIAQNATVVMARGLYSNWKQSVAYFFVNSQFKAVELCSVIEECIMKLSESGLYVDALMSDMGSNFIQLSNLLGVTPDNPEFKMCDKNIIYLFDPCHLIKATRTNLMQNVFCFDQKRTSWSFVEFFYQQDKKQPYRCAPKLTDSHIYPTNFEKMRVKLATQVLSNTVASGMNTYMSLGALPADSIGTIEVIEKFNKLFDLLNSSDLDNKNTFKTVFEGADYQITYLEEMLEFIKKIKIYNNAGDDVTSKSRFKNSWIVTINGIKKLWEKLASADFKYLKTRRVNQDCIENFFGSIRQQGGNCINPTPIQFERAFRKLFCQNYLHSNKMNCKDDLDEILTKLNSCDTSFADTLDSESDCETKAISLPNYDYRQEIITTQNAFTYVCGYLIKKALQIHSCQTCQKFSKESEELDVNKLLTHFKAYDTEKSIYGGLRVPNEQFINYIYQLEQIFVSSFEDICTKSKISHNYLENMKNVQFYHPCSEFPLQYVLKLFVRLRLFYSLKYVNRDMKTKGQKKNRKIAILSHV